MYATDFGKAEGAKLHSVSSIHFRESQKAVDVESKSEEKREREVFIQPAHGSRITCKAVGAVHAPHVFFPPRFGTN